ncbi:Protein of unknown function (DUF4232) [Prauserella halophila]|nr:Protein of unknown function (DUF4232) [Prauserella halophila]
MRSRVPASLGLLSVLLLGACTATPAPEAVDTPTAAPPPPGEPCPAGGLRVAADGSEAAMGLRILHLEVTNCGGRPQGLSGYPRLRVLDENRTRMDVRVREGSAGIATVDGFDDPPRSVTLEPGGTARTGLMWRNTNTGTTAPGVGEYLEIAPSGTRPWQPVEQPAPDRNGLHIDLGTTGTLGVRAWYQDDGR